MRVFILVISLFLSACTPSTPTPKIVHKSFYLHKNIMLFELNNGFCSQKTPLANKGYKYIWRSDRGNIFDNLFNWDSYPPCIIELQTNEKNIITAIKILEDDIKCIQVLR